MNKLTMMSPEGPGFCAGLGHQCFDIWENGGVPVMSKYPKT
jgi:hypothetical protein